MDNDNEEIQSATEVTQEQPTALAHVSIFKMHGKRGYSIKVMEGVTRSEVMRLIRLARDAEERITQETE